MARVWEGDHWIIISLFVCFWREGYILNLVLRIFKEVPFRNCKSVYPAPSDSNFWNGSVIKSITNSDHWTYLLPCFLKVPGNGQGKRFPQPPPASSVNTDTPTNLLLSVIPHLWQVWKQGTEDQMAWRTETLLFTCQATKPEGGGPCEQSNEGENLLVIDNDLTCCITLLPQYLKIFF